MEWRGHNISFWNADGFVNVSIATDGSLNRLTAIHA
jgi:hypothetical protein